MLSLLETREPVERMTLSCLGGWETLGELGSWRFPSTLFFPSLLYPPIVEKAVYPVAVLSDATMGCEMQQILYSICVH